MKAIISFEVVHSVWGADEDVFAGGVHVLDGDCPCGEPHPDPDDEFLRLLAGAEAAGAVVVIDAAAKQRKSLDDSVQSQEAGEAAYAAAQPVYDLETGDIAADGPWRHGNLVQFVSGAEDRLAYDDLLDDDHDDKLDAELRAEIEFQLAKAKAELETVEAPE